MKPRFLLASLAVLLSQFTHVLSAQDVDTYVANDIQLVGTLGDGIKIEMHLQRDGNQPFWTLAQGECADVKGQYYYRSQVRPIDLSGRFCLANHTMELSYALVEGAEWQERFVGKWDATLGSFSGEWTLKKTNKTLSFALKTIETNVQTEDKVAFFALLDQKLATEPDADWFETQYRIEGFEWENGIGKALNTEAVEVRHFSPLRFDWYHNWSNAGTGHDQYETFQVLPATSGLFVLQSYRSDYTIPAGEADDGELLFDEGCESMLLLWRWKNATWENVTAQYLPAVLTEALEVGDRNHECEVEILQDAVRVGKIKRYWVDGKFVEK
jgi:hypothetical protein